MIASGMDPIAEKASLMKNPINRTSAFSLRRAAAAALMASVAALAACDSVEDRVAERQAAGEAYLEANESGKALIEFEGALQLAPNHAPAHLAIGRIRETRGELPAAVAHYALAVESDPTLTEARLRLGVLQLLQGDVDGAAAEAEAVRAAAPDDPEALALAAGVALRRQDFETARTLIDAARAIAPDALQVLSVDVSHLIATGKIDVALSRIGEALALHPKELALHAARLSLLETAGETAAISAQLRVMTETFPDDVAIREALVEFSLRTNDPATAESELRALLAAEPARTERAADLIRLILATRGVEAARTELEAMVAVAPDRADLQLLLAEFEHQSGESDRAETLLRDLADAGGAGETEARTRLARLLLAAGDEAGADREIAAALAASPGDAAAVKLQISRMIDRGEIDAASATARAALDEAPENPDLLRLDARAQELAGNIDLANDRHARAVRAAEYEADAAERYVAFLRRTNRLGGAETVLVEAMRRDPNSARLATLLASVRIDLEDWTGVERAAAALDRLAPDRARAARAEALLRQRRFAESGALVEGSDELAISQTVQAHLGAGEPEQAAAFLDALIAEEPENLQALGLRGAVHETMGEFDAAEARYRAVLARAPGNSAAHVALAGLVTRRDGLAAGEAMIRAGLDAAPDDLSLLTQLAQYRQVQGDLDGAIEIYERIYARAPDALLVANNLASLLSDHRADDPEALRRAYVIAGRLETTASPEWRDTYAWTRHLMGEHARARAVIEPVVKARPDNPWIRYHAGMIHLALKEMDAARDHLEAALQAAGGAPFEPRALIEKTLSEVGRG